MKINQQHIAGVFKIIFCILLLLMAFCCGYSQCNSAINVALNKTATASSLENAGYPASNAFDGNSGSRWSSGFTDNEFIYVDLGGTYPLCQVVLNWETAYGKNFSIDISANAVTWVTVASITGNTSQNNTISITGSARYVRMKGTLRATGYGYSLYEFQVFSTNPSPVCPTTNIALNKPGIVSSLENAVFGAANAFDGNPATRWSSAFADPQSIYVDLGAQYALCSVDLSWEVAYATNFEIDGSNNAVAWTTLSAITGNSAVTNSIPVSGAYRYVRMYGTTRATGFGYSLYEFAVHGSAVLPVQLSDFTAKELAGNAVQLNWATAAEWTSKGFQIQRSSDAMRFDSVGFVTGTNNSSIARNYGFTDHLPRTGIWYYRLKQIDEDGRIDYSNILQLKTREDTDPVLLISPNPAGSWFGLKGLDPTKSVEIRIADLSGHLLRTVSKGTADSQITVADLKPGIYLVSVKTASQFSTLKLIKR